MELRAGSHKERRKREVKRVKIAINGKRGQSKQACKYDFSD
jgi:hypothetical protein